MNRKDLRRFKKAELYELAKSNDFGFKPKKSMKKVELVEMIFGSKQFKQMKSALPKKEKRKMSQKQIDNLKRGRDKKNKIVDELKHNTEEPENQEMIKETLLIPQPIKEVKKMIKPEKDTITEKSDNNVNTEVEYFKPKNPNVNKKEYDITASKEDKVGNPIKGMMKMKSRPETIPTEVIAVSQSKENAELMSALAPNEQIPYESIIIDNERVKLAKEENIKSIGAENVEGLSGEKKAVITSAQVEIQDQRLDGSIISSHKNIVKEMEQIDALINNTVDENDKVFLQRLKNAIRIDKESMLEETDTGLSTETEQVFKTKDLYDENEIKTILDEIEYQKQINELKTQKAVAPEDISTLEDINKQIFDSKILKETLIQNITKDLLSNDKITLQNLTGIYSSIDSIINKLKKTNFKNIQHNDLFKNKIIKINKLEQDLKDMIAKKISLNDKKQEERIIQQFDYINNIEQKHGHSQYSMEAKEHTKKNDFITKLVNKQNKSYSLTGTPVETIRSQLRLRL